MNIAVVVEIRKIHCSRLKCEHIDKCTNCKTLNCWLRHAYLDTGVWVEACKYDNDNLELKPETRQYTEQVKKIKEELCTDCLNSGTCSNCETLDCWLRKTHLRNNTWSEACQMDIINAQAEHLTQVINKKLVDDYKEKNNLK